MAKKSKIGVGLDVGSHKVQLTVLRSRKEGIVVETVASRELGHDAIVEGSVMDAEQVCEKIGELLREHRLKGKAAAISVGGRRVMIKRIATDEMTDSELRAAIEYEARSQLPFDTSEVTMDYARLPQDLETGRMDVLLVAAKNEMVFDATETLRWAGGKPALLEAEPFALQAALTEAGYLEDEAAVAALHIGFQSTDVVLFKQGQFEGNRDLNIGGKTYIEGLIRELGIPFERAAGMLARTSCTDEEREALAAIAARVADKLVELTERSFPDYFGARGDVPLVRIVLCGGGAALPYLEEELKQKFELEVVVANPFRQFEVNSKSVDPAAVESAPDFTASVGLALRALGENHGGFNLLFPDERPEAKKRNYAGLSTILPVVGASSVLLAIVMSYLAQENRLAGLETRLAEVRKEADTYRDKIAMVEELNRKRADISARVNVVSELDRNRFARIRLLQAINDAMPDLTWITDIQETNNGKGACVNVTGMTSSNLKVSQLMTNLLQSPTVRGVDLLVSEQTQIAGTDVTKFTLQAAVPDLGLTEAPAGKPQDQLKRGAKAVKDQRAAQKKLDEEASPPAKPREQGE